MDDNTNSQIFSTLNAVSCRLSAIEQKMERAEEQLQGCVKSGSDAGISLNLSTTPSQDVDEDSDTGDDTIIPTSKFLKTSRHIKEALDLRLQELAKINEHGKFKEVITIRSQ